MVNVAVTSASQSSNNPPPKQIHGAAYGVAGGGYILRNRSPIWARLGGLHWALRGVRGPHGVPQQRFHICDRRGRVDGNNGLRGHNQRIRMPQMSLHGQTRQKTQPFLRTRLKTMSLWDMARHSWPETGVLYPQSMGTLISPRTAAGTRDSRHSRRTPTNSWLGRDDECRLPYCENTNRTKQKNKRL